MSEHSEIWAPVAESLGTWDYDEGLAIDLSRIPQSVIIEAARRGLIHVLNNEAMSKAGTVVDKAIAAGEVTAEGREAKRQELINQYRLGYVESFYDGTWGTGRRASAGAGPRVDPLETEFNRLVAKQVREVMTKDKRFTYDKEDKTWFVVIKATGERRTWTLEQAITGYVSKMPDEKRAALMTAAQEIVEAKKRQAAASKVTAAAEPMELEDMPI